MVKGMASVGLGLLNSEKKFKDVDIITSSVSQIYGASTYGGYVVHDVTPVIEQGVENHKRIGSSLKYTGMTFPIQFTGQKNCMSGRKLKVMFFRAYSADNNVDGTEVLTDYLDPNPLNGLYDMGSPRAYRQGKHDGIKLLRSKTYTLKAPTIADAGVSSVELDDIERSGFTCRFNVKLNEVARFAHNTSTKPDGLRYFLVIMCDKGNHHQSTVATADVPVTTVQSGVSYRLAQRVWWIDN
jgi:hypothetical protein